MVWTVFRRSPDEWCRSYKGFHMPGYFPPSPGHRLKRLGVCWGRRRSGWRWCGRSRPRSDGLDSRLSRQTAGCHGSGTRSGSGRPNNGRASPDRGPDRVTRRRCTGAVDAKPPCRRRAGVGPARRASRTLVPWPQPGEWTARLMIVDYLEPFLNKITSAVCRRIEISRKRLLFFT